MSKRTEIKLQYGRFDGIIAKDGLLVNIPHIDTWSKQAVVEYIGFLHQLLPYCINEKGKQVNLDIADRTTLELKPCLEPEGQFIVKVRVDGEYILSISCDHIGVYGGKPPTYSLEHGKFGIAGIAAKLMIIDPSLKDTIPEATRSLLGEAVRVADARV